MEWKNIEQVDIDKYCGFIYLITYTDGTMYGGQKSFWKRTRLKPRKTDRVNAKRIKVSESDWRKYNGSTKASKGKTIKSKEILRLCETSTDLNYWETQYLMVNNVLFDTNWLNQNVAGKYFAGKVTGSKEHIKY
jgi:hypothetical protein